jgi:putative FmdB family regulatory protein
VPIYEYRCPNGHVFELFQRMGDPAPEACPTCDAKPVERVLYPVAVHFKGSGFYSTDYGRSRKTAKEGESGASGGDSKPGDSKPADSKSETKKTETSKSSD